MPSTTLEPYDSMSIAVIGLACRLPGDASNAEMFWDMLCDGRSAVSKVPKSRWNVDSFYHNTKGRLNSSITQNGNFLSQDISVFDATFFNISRTEAMGMDPQQRLMLEVSYEAFENAGLSIESLAGTQTGCYVGGFTSDWREMQFRDPDSAPLYTFSGVGNEVLANRLSWFYDLRGPSMTVETACSSSLVSLHVACQSIRAGESNLALVGGANLFLNPDLFAALSNQHFLSPDGLCKAFDASGDGYARGEGFAAVVLKPIDIAIRDGDVIRAVIRGTGTNQDGKTRGLTLPSGEAQEDLIRSTYQLAGLDLKDTDYFEAHGTGTAAGDLAELGAIGRTLGAARNPGQKLLVGSVKTNIGHTESVAGLAGLIKAIFILERGLIPANLHFKTPNPNIPFDQWNIKVPTSTTEWRSKGIRRISVNSFGFAGANAHAIIEDKESYLAERKRRGRLSMTTIFSSTNGHASSKVNGEQSLSAKRLFVLTGNDLNSLRRQRLQLSTYVQQQSAKFAKDIFQTDKFLSDLAFTLSEKRSRLPWKSSCAASTIKQLVNNLEAGDFTAIRSKSERPQVGFVFTGQGAQWARMGIELLQYHVFRKTVEAANKHLGELGCQWSIVEELCQDEKISKLADPLYSQTICTVLQIALVDLMSSWGVRPKSVVGHSSGEIAAAYSFGALKRSDACKIAYYRGVLSSQVVQTSSTGIKGAMMAVGCSEFQARESIKRLNCGKAIVACINSPISVTISGDESAIDELHGAFQKEGIFARKLKVETAYHSHHMTPIAGSYFEALRDIETLEARQDCEMFSSVMGRGVDASELGAAYWARNLVSPVLFSDAVNQMFSQVKTGGSAVIDTVVEIGPHAALRGPVMQTLKHFNIPEMAYHSIVVRGQDGIQTALSCGEALFGLGVSVDIHAINNSAKPADNYNSIENPKQLMNLPGYPWDHSHSYWSESRVSIQHRNRALPRLSLVGAPYPSLGQHERQWRTFLRITEEPWIQDHKMQSSILYPAAGFIAMTIEATRQIADPGKTPHAFRLREIKIDTAVLMNEDVDVECVLQMRPHATGPWFEFNISTSTSGMDLQQNCSGLIVIEYKSDSESEIESAMTSERRLENEMTRKRYHEIEVMCSDVEDPRSFYRELESAGMNYGPTFQNVIQIHHGSGHSCCTVVIGDTGCDPVVPVSNRDNPHAQPHIIHPTVLDSIFQTAFAALKSELGPIKEALVPNAIAEISVLANISFAAGSQFRGYTKCSKHGFKDVLADISMLDDGLGEEVIGIKGFRCTGTGVATGDGMEEAGARNLCSKFTWKPAIAFLSTEEQKELVEAAISAETADNLRRKATREKTEAYKSICYALQSVEVKDIASTQLRTFYQWMQAQKEIYESHMVSLHDVEITGEVLSLEQNSTTSIKSRDLAGILLGKKSSLSPELDEESFLDQHLRNVRGMDVSMTKLSLFLQLLAHTNSALSVLELGSSSTSTLSSSLPASTNYLYTCKNASLLSVAKSKLQTSQHSTDFKTLDIEKPLESQDFAGQDFDVVVAYNIFSGGKDTIKALTNAKKLLKEGGKLCLVEATSPGVAAVSDLGGFSRWWRKSGHQPNRLKNLETLKSRLAFHQLQLEFASHDSREEKIQQTSLVVASVTKTPAVVSIPQIDETVIIEPPNPTETSRSLVMLLKQHLECHGVQGHSLPWGANISSLKEKNCIVLAELTTPLLTNLTAEDFAIIQEIILTAKTILWVTALEEPANAPVVGLARTVRNELATIRFRTLKVTPSLLISTDRLALLITKVVTTASADDEFQEENGVLEISRLEEDSAMNEYVGNMLGGEKIFPTKIAQAGGPLKLHIGNPGMLDSLCFKPVETTDGSLQSDEVEVQVRASGLNFRDIMVSMGQIPDKFIGLEASGIILRVGNNVQNFNIGDEVSFLGHGAHSTVFRTKAAFCQLIPCGLSFAQAACLPLAHCTAYHALINKARAKKGQSILIHSAAGGVGQATIQLAQHLGLEIFATVGSPEKRKILREIYDLPDDHILYSRDLSFAKAVLRLTNGRGVDCVLNSLAGEALRQTWHCIAPFGCFIEIGIKDVLGNSGLDMAPFLRDTTFQTINLEHVQRERPELMAEIMTETFALFRQGVTKPIFPMTVFSVSEVESAFRLMQTGKHTGKIALEYHAQDIVPVLCNPSTTAQSNININGSSTYVLVGGLGGLGRSLAKLLVHLGARYICFISRSGSSSTSPEVTKFIDDLRSREVQANIYSCDIANFEILEGTLHKCSSEMPPIKGVFQCAMVLQDALFETMTHTQWNNSLRSKVQGSWNLHKATPTSLDFFIILSSFSGIIGNRGQSNYAAACTYQDALAMLRHKKGLKAVSIDLGIMRDVGVLAEKGAVGDLKEWEEPFGIREPEFHALIKRAIGQLPVKENEDDFDLPVPPQIVTGIPTAQMFAAASISEPFYYNDAKFSILANTGIGVNGLSNNVSNRSISIRELLSKVESHAEATCLILAALVAKVAKLSQRGVADVDVQKSLHSYGVDSLVAVEIRNWIVKEMLADVSVFEVLASVTMGEFAGGVVKKCKGLPEGVS